MTTLAETKNPCPLCQHEHEETVVMSTNTVGGAPDLDGRPGEMMRSTIVYGVCVCPACGYAHPPSHRFEDDQSVPGSEKIREFIATDDYRKQLHASDSPDLANAFLCRALIKVKLGELGDAVWSAMNAAWACDDHGTAEAARRCRHRAIALWKRADGEGARIFDEKGFKYLLLMDLYRRTSQFDEAAHVYRRVIDSGLPDRVRELLHDEIEWIDREDTAAHSLDEAEQNA